MEFHIRLVNNEIPLNNNVDLFSNRAQEVMELRGKIAKLVELIGDENPIKLYEFDGCFTNGMMRKLLKKILIDDIKPDETIKTTVEQEDLDNIKYVEISTIDINNKHTYPSHNKGIIIMGGHTANVYEQNGEDFTFNFTKPIMDSIEQNTPQRLYGTCFSFQSIAKAIGAEIVKSTHEVGLFIEKINRIHTINKGIRQDMPAGAYTRSGYVRIPKDKRSQMDVVGMSSPDITNKILNKNVQTDEIDISAELNTLISNLTLTAYKLEEIIKNEINSLEKSEESIYSDLLLSIRDLTKQLTDACHCSININLDNQPIQSFNIARDYNQLLSDLKHILNKINDSINRYQEDISSNKDIDSLYHDHLTAYRNIVSDLLESGLVPADEQPVSITYCEQKIIGTQSHPEINFFNEDDINELLKYYTSVAKNLPIPTHKQDQIIEEIKKNLEDSIKNVRDKELVGPHMMLNILTHFADGLIHDLLSGSNPPDSTPEA